MKKLRGTPQPKRIFTCPQCNKARMSRPTDHVVSQEKQKHETRTGEEIELHVDICDNCKRRNWRQYFEPTKADIRRVLKGLKEDAEAASEETSLEDLL